MIVGSQGQRSTVENQDILVQKVGEKAVAIKAMVGIILEAEGGLPKISLEEQLHLSTGNLSL